MSQPDMSSLIAAEEKQMEHRQKLIDGLKSIQAIGGIERATTEAENRRLKAVKQEEELKVRLASAQKRLEEAELGVVDAQENARSIIADAQDEAARIEQGAIRKFNDARKSHEDVVTKLKDEQKALISDLADKRQEVSRMEDRLAAAKAEAKNLLEKV